VSNRVLVDTAFVIALINRRDQFHPQALELADRFEGHPLLVTDAILLEIGNALARSHKPEAIEVIEQFLASDEVEIVYLSTQLFQQAFALYRQYADKEWSLVDCISFVVMRQAGVNQVLTFDRHFAQAGFEILATETPGA
jgi:predicted nucleic acid-binding protein